MIKKLFAIILALTLVFSLAACSSDNAKTDIENTTDDIEQAADKAGDAVEDVLTGTIDEIKDFMYVIKTDDGKYYPFNINENDPYDIKNFKTGDKVTLKYQGTLSEVDPFTGKIISLEKMK